MFVWKEREGENIAAQADIHSTWIKQPSDIISSYSRLDLFTDLFFPFLGWKTQNTTTGQARARPKIRQKTTGWWITRRHARTMTSVTASLIVSLRKKRLQERRGGGCKIYPWETINGETFPHLYSHTHSLELSTHTHACAFTCCYPHGGSSHSSQTHLHHTLLPIMAILSAPNSTQLIYHP